MVSKGDLMQMNIPASDKGVLSHGEELEAINLALKLSLAQPALDSRLPCPWESVDSCRNCGLYGKCFPLEANHGEA